MPTPSPSSPLRIAILECDTPLPLTATKYGGYGGVFTALLHASAERLGWSKSDLHITTHHIVNDEVDENGEIKEEVEEELRRRYPRLEDIDAALITGSRHNAFDSTPWILTLLAFTATLLSHPRIRTLGICYGHQIVGRALGGQVTRSTGDNGGWELSVCAVSLTPKGREIFGRQEIKIQQMHRDMLSSLPPSTTFSPSSSDAPREIHTLGSSSSSAIQGLYIPDLALTVQGHPEFNTEIVREILEARKGAGVFGEEVFRDGMGRVGEGTDGVGVGEGFLRFLVRG